MFKRLAKKFKEKNDADFAGYQRGLKDQKKQDDKILSIKIAGKDKEIEEAIREKDLIIDALLKKKIEADRRVFDIENEITNLSENLGNFKFACMEIESNMLATQRQNAEIEKSQLSVIDKAHNSSVFLQKMLVKISGKIEDYKAKT